MNATEFKAHADLIYSLSLSHDGKTLATAGFDGVAKLWELSNRKEVRTFSGHTSPVYGHRRHTRWDLPPTDIR